jgi:large subunit ribosomal protein L5
MAALRLKDKYLADVAPALRSEFRYGSPMAVPRVAAVKLNMGIGKKILQKPVARLRKGVKRKVAHSPAKKTSGRKTSVNQRIVDGAVAELAAIAGQRPVVSRAKRPIAGFNLRAGMPVGCTVTLRGTRMWEFLDRLIAISLPRVRDFQGVSPKLDGRGNYTLGIQEHTIFPEIDYTKVDVIKGMNVTVITTARTDREGYELLRLLGMPFRTAA